MAQSLNKMNDYLIRTYPNRNITFVSGEGVYLTADIGRKYLDFGSNYGVNIFGYSHPRITKELEKQLQQLTSLHGSFGNKIRDQAAENLVKICGGKIHSVFFSNSGAEAIEAALKFAAYARGKKKFIAVKNSFHGKTLGALSATGQEKYRLPFLPLLWDFTFVPLNDISALEQAVDELTAGIIIEPVQGEGGIVIPSMEFMKTVAEICRQNKILLITDEIQTGCGRTGTFLAAEQFGLEADIVCLGKGLAGGIPVGATLVSADIAVGIPLHLHTSTFGGNPLAGAGILAVLAEFNNTDLFDHIRETGQYFLSELSRLKHPEIVEARGLGLMLALELNVNATPYLKKLQENGIIAIPAGSNILRFLPPFLITKKEIERLMAVLHKLFNN